MWCWICHCNWRMTRNVPFGMANTGYQDHSYNFFPDSSSISESSTESRSWQKEVQELLKNPGLRRDMRLAAQHNLDDRLQSLGIKVSVYTFWGGVLTTYYFMASFLKFCSNICDIQASYGCWISLKIYL